MENASDRVEEPAGNEPGEERPEQDPPPGRPSEAAGGRAASSADRGSAEKPCSSSRERPSYKGFDNLADEFAARAQSRENVNTFNELHPSPGRKPNDKAIREQIDPYGPENTNAPGRKEPSPELVREKDAAWPAGVGALGELPGGE
jgi:hypothetical protein